MSTMFKEEEYTKRFDPALWKKLGKLIVADKRLIWKLAIVMVIVAIIDAIFPLLNRYVIDNIIIPKNYDNIGTFIWVFMSIVVVQGTLVYILVATAGKIDMNVCYTIRKNGFQKLQDLSFSYYDKTPAGWIMARMTSDCQKLGDTIAWGMVDIVWGFSMMTFISIVLLVLNWKLALLTLTTVPLLVITSLWFQKKILKSNREVRKVNSHISGVYNEGILGAKTTKTLVREEENFNEFKDVSKKLRSSSIRTAVLSSFYLPVILTIASVGTAIALSYGGHGVINEVITYGTLAAFISYTIHFFNPVRELARVLAELQSAQASAERLLSMIETEPEIKDNSKVLRIYGTYMEPKVENWPRLYGNIHFDNVDFRYSTGEPILTNFNLSVNAGEKIALVGETGSGKSTIVNLICRFYEPTGGTIFLDGVDYRERSQNWLQSHLGYVLQTPHLFSGTIADNIRYGCESATDEEIVVAAKMVNAHNFIIKMNGQYNAPVGEGGTFLSTGEKQLLSFARAALANPSIFILDEATSSVDTETEFIIQQATEKLLKGRTSFIIAHRLSTVKTADRILVLHKGEIIEEGDHNTLISQKGHYYKLYTSQFIPQYNVA